MNTEILDRLLRFALHEAKNEGDIFQSKDYAELETLAEVFDDLLEALKKLREAEKHCHGPNVLVSRRQKLEAARVKADAAIARATGGKDE